MVQLHPILAGQIGSAINSRSVAAEMIDTALRTQPYNHETFLYWVKAHREASGKLGALGIDVITYTEATI